MPERYERLLFRIALAALALVIAFVAFRGFSGDDGTVTNLSTSDPTESEAKNISTGEETDTPGVLALTSPAADVSVIGPAVTVEGTAPVGTPVVISDEPSGKRLAIKRVAEDGTFIANLTLAPGFHDIVLSSTAADDDASARIEVLAPEPTTTEAPPETTIDLPRPTTTPPRVTTPTTRFVPRPTTTATPPVFFPPATTAAPTTTTTTQPPAVVLPPPPPATTPTTVKPTTTTAKPTPTTAKPTPTTVTPTTAPPVGPTTSIVAAPAP